MSTRQERIGFVLGLIAVTGFSLGLPMTKIAVLELNPVVVGLGRSFLAGLIAMAFLIITRTPWPKKNQLLPLASVGLGISIFFPLLSSFAMRFLPASHGAIITGTLPIATAAWISLFNHEKPSSKFWLSSALGFCIVFAYALLKSGGILHTGDILLLLTVILGGLGYAQGAMVAKSMGGVRVMCWGLVIALPITGIAIVPQLLSINTHLSLKTIGAMTYLVFISQLLGMMLWYKALSLGSIARVSQVQLLQPFLTVILSALFFGEQLDVLALSAALLVLLSIQLSRNTKVELKQLP